MKTASRLPSLRFHTALVAASAVLGLTASHAQVVIEGGPGVVQISDRDGSPEPVVPGKAPYGTPVPLEKQAPVPAPLKIVTPKAVEVRPDPSSSVTVLVPTKPVTPSLPLRTEEAGSVLAAVPAVDVDAAKRKAELIRELGIANSGTGAKIAILAENLYKKNSAMIDSLAHGRLGLLGEFIRLSPHQNIGVTYHYSPDLHNEELAWDRSVGLVEWMKSKGSLATSTFTVNNPTPSSDPEVVPPLGMVEVVIDYR